MAHSNCPLRSGAAMLALGGSARPGRHGPVWDLGDTFTAYPPAEPSGPWRAQWRDTDGARRACRARTEQLLAAKLEPLLRQRRGEPVLGHATGAELVAWYLSPDRHPADRPWSRSHLSGQSRLCRRFLLPVIGSLPCDRITLAHLQQAVNAANTPDSGARVAKCTRAMVNAGIAAGYLKDHHWPIPHWQARGRPTAPPRVRTAGLHRSYINHRQLPSHQQVTALAEQLVDDPAAPWWYELMVHLAAGSGLRFGELAALTPGTIRIAQREIDVLHKVIEIDGQQYLEQPKGRIQRTTIYAETGPTGYNLAEALHRRATEIRHEQETGANPDGLLFHSPRGRSLYHSNFTNRVLVQAYTAIGWRDEPQTSNWTWHTLRHVFCTTALHEWGLPLEDVAILAGHTNSRTTQETYINAVEGILERARAATTPRRSRTTTVPRAPTSYANPGRPSLERTNSRYTTTTKNERKLRRIAAFA